MESQPTEDKLSVLNNIFGNDLTQSIITRTLHENDDAFDPTVEKLLSLPSNKPQQPAPQVQPAQTPMDPASVNNIKQLHNMFSDLTQSVITTVYETNERDVDGTVETLLNMTSHEVAGAGRREGEVARQHEEIRAYEEFKKLQQQLEVERAQTEQKKRAEEEAKKKDEHTKAMQEQEKMLLEFQRKKAEEEHRKALEVQKKKELEEKQKKAVEEQQKKVVEEQQKKALQEQQKKVLEEQQKKGEDERQKKVLEEHKRKISEEIEKERLKIEETLKVEKEKLLAGQKRQEEIVKLIEEQRRREEERIMSDQREKERLLAEEKLAKKRLEEENQRILQREEDERKHHAEKEKRMREEQDTIRKEYEEKVRKMEAERRSEEQKRTKEEEEKAKQQEEKAKQQEADMKKVLELERLKLDEQRKKVEEQKTKAEEKLKALELATKRREEEAKKREEDEIRRRAEEEERRLMAEQQKRREEEEQKKREEEQKKREEEESERLLKEEERMRKEMSDIKAQEQFAASAVMVPLSNIPQVEVHAISEGNEIKGAWRLTSGILLNDAWLGLFARRSINTNSGYMYLGKEKTSGEFSFKTLTPGHYEVRIFSAKPVTSRIAETPALHVGPQVVTFNIQMQEQQIAVNYQLDPPNIPSNRDWIGIYQKDNRKNREYLASVYGNANGTVMVQIPRTPGLYEARLFAAGSSYNDSASQEFIVEDHDRITAEHTQDKVKARWVMKTVETTGSDWIGLFAVGEPSQKYLASVYTSANITGSADITLPKDLPSGSYELRLFSYKIGKYTPFKTSNVITIM